MTKAALTLSVVLLLLMATASLSGLLVDGLYRDNLLVRAAWEGNDLVTLLLAVPLLAIATFAAHRGGARALLAWMGLLAYIFYNYAFYLFGAAFNALFLVYVALLVGATLGLILGFTSPDLKTIVRGVRIVGVHRAVGVLVIVVSTALGLFWTIISMGYLWTGDVPAMVTAVDHPTNLTGALDLWLVVSFGLLGGIWLWRGRPWQRPGTFEAPSTGGAGSGRYP